MRRAPFIIGALVAASVSGCGGWPILPTRPAVPDQSDAELFVVTVDCAWVIEHASTFPDRVVGRVERGWAVPPREWSAEEDESPRQLATRLGWEPIPSTELPKDLSIPLSAVVAVRVYDPHTAATVVVLVLGVLGTVALVVLISAGYALSRG
jgi:hypothetical protein